MSKPRPGEHTVDCRGCGKTYTARWRHIAARAAQRCEDRSCEAFVNGDQNDPERQAEKWTRAYPLTFSEQEWVARWQQQPWLFDDLTRVLIARRPDDELRAVDDERRWLEGA